MGALSQDFVNLRDQTSREVRESLEIVNQVKDDYIVRISRIYDDQTNLV